VEWEDEDRRRRRKDGKADVNNKYYYTKY